MAATTLTLRPRLSSSGSNLTRLDVLAEPRTKMVPAFGAPSRNGRIT